MPEPSLQEFFDDEGDIDFPKVVEIIHTNLRNFLNAVLEESFTLAADENYRIQVSEVGNKLCDQSLDAYLDRAHIVSSEFYVELETGFYKSNTAISKQKDIDHSAIQTIDTDVIELTVTADQLVNRSVERHSEIIERLALQLEELSIHSHQDFNCRCLHPEEFYNIFLNSITPLNLPVDGKILILKLMYQVVSPNLNDFYQSMNEFLLNLEIDGESVSDNVPSTDSIDDDNEVEEKESSSLLSMTTGQFFAPVEQELWNQEYDDNYGTDNEIDSSSEETNDSYGPGQAGLNEATVSVLLQPYQPGTQSNSSAAQRRQFVRALSSVQKIEAATNAVFKATQIKTAVQRTLQEKGALDAVEIVENEDKVIDFVSKIFEVILDDDSLCDAIKALLAKLQISTIKLALVDFTFFQNSKHPARQLLNKLTSIGLSVNGKEEALFKRLKDIINLITDNFETDVQVFSLALKEITKIESHPELITQPSNYTHKLKSQRSAAKRVVIHTIKKITKGRSIPNQVLEFCLKCWAPHMAYIYMNKGRSSQEWRNSVRTLRRVSEVSQGIHTYGEILEFISTPDQFFNHIRQDLDQFSNHSDDFSDALEEAEVWYLTYLSKVTQEAEKLDEFENEDELIDQPQDEESSEQQDNVIHLFSNLSPDDKSSKENNTDETPQEATQDLENEKEAQATDSIVENSNQSLTHDQTNIEELEPDSDVIVESAADLNIAEHLPASIVPGVWMEIYQGEDKAKRRLKFSNSDRENNILFFTDRSGDYRFEIDLLTFLDDLSAGRSSLINESNRFDLALSSVINNIRSNQDGT